MGSPSLARFFELSCPSNFDRAPPENRARGWAPGRGTVFVCAERLSARCQTGTTAASRSSERFEGMCMADGRFDLNRAGLAQEKSGRKFAISTEIPHAAQKAAARRSVNHELIKNIWNHPKTSAAGLLIAVASVAGVLSQQGVSLGKVGTGTVVSLASALATALLGLMAKDPGQPASHPPQPTLSTSRQAKLGAWMLIALLIPLPWMQGCTAAGVAAEHRELDAGLAKRGGHGGLDRGAAGAGRRADLRRGNHRLRRGQQSAGGAGQGVPGQSLGERAGDNCKPRS